MIITIRDSESSIRIDIGEGADFSAWSEADYGQRLEKAERKGKDTGAVRPRGAEELVGALNDADHDAWRKWRAMHCQPAGPSDDGPADIEGLGRYSACEESGYREIEEDSAYQEQQRRLLDGGLSEGQLALIERCFVLNDPNEDLQDIAGEMGVTPNALSCRLQRARKAARRILEAADRKRDRRPPNG